MLFDCCHWIILSKMHRRTTQSQDPAAEPLPASKMLPKKDRNVVRQVPPAPIQRSYTHCNTGPDNTPSGSCSVDPRRINRRHQPTPNAPLNRDWSSASPNAQLEGFNDRMDSLPEGCLTRLNRIIAALSITTVAIPHGGLPTEKERQWPGKSDINKTAWFLHHSKNGNLSNSVKRGFFGAQECPKRRTIY